MKKAWHILTRMAVITLALVCFLTLVRSAVCDHDDGCTTAECVCVCACHAAVEPAIYQDLCALERTVFIPSEYVASLGTSLPADIFRPPLAHR